MDPMAFAQSETSDFDLHVAPLLIDRCLQCHVAERPGGPEGALDLSELSAVMRGGESGPAVVPGAPSESELWKRVAAGDMPPDDPLGEDEKETFRAWIAAGAKWGKGPIDPFSVTTKHRAGSDWWSLQPLERPAVPRRDSFEVVHAIDAFVRNRLREVDIAPSPPASPRVLIRRIHFDLLGLPPTHQQVIAFEKAMQSDPKTAVDDLVDRLLRSRHHGERWGRHWLDVVRFGESQGFERDMLRPDAWHYRQWVIDAFNDDMPYDEFVRHQLAGDVLSPGDPDAITATGFLVAGPWDEVGQKQRSEAMKAVVRQDEVEDYVGTIGQTFLGLTVNCARCHDHKFDPIRQREYYQLASAVGGVKHGIRDVISQKNEQQITAINADIRSIQDQVASLESVGRNRLLAAKDASEALPARVTPISRWEFDGDTSDSIGGADASQHSGAKVVNGQLVLDAASGFARTKPQDVELFEKTLEAWVWLDELDQRGGAAMSVHQSRGGAFDAIVYGEREPKKWMSGSDFFKRTQDLSAPQELEAANQFVHVAVTYAADGKIAVYRNGQPYGVAYDSSGPWRFRRGTWQVQFGLRTGGPDPGRQLRGLLEAAQLYDRVLTPEEVDVSFRCENAALTHDAILQALDDGERERREGLLGEIAALQERRKQMGPYSVYAVRPAKADVAYVLDRGNPRSRGEKVSAGGIAAIGSVDPRFGLSPDASDAERRLRLAGWVTDKQNPLLARVIVNRLWHYHFGAGLVPTPNDFGFNGGLPSHPELLDWLACELTENGWSLKHIHRLIVTSATYRQSSRSRSDGVAIDSKNRLLWRKTPQRLEAEALRDTILSVAGQLNPQYGGPSYQDFKTFVNNTQFYEMTDRDHPDVYRRTVYRTWIRSGRNSLLDAFDCPDPSTTAPQRAVTTTPIQSLALMNNSFVLRMSDRFASRVTAEVGEQPALQIERAFGLAYGRKPTESEGESIGKFVSEHGLPALCRAILNSNEFIYVD